MSKLYTIGKLAKELAINIETIRFYQRKGLVDTPPAIAGPYRQYGPKERRRLKLILYAKKLGFKLEEIRALISLLEIGKVDIRDLVKFLEIKIDALRQRRTEIDTSISHIESMVKEISINKTCRLIVEKDE